MEEGAGLVRRKTGDVRGQRKLIRVAGHQTKVKSTLISADNNHSHTQSFILKQCVYINKYVLWGIYCKE